MRFEAESSSVHKLLATLTTSFFVPVFQRGYSWGQSDIRHLFQTVFTSLDSQLRGDDTTPFLGACILVESEDGIGPNQVSSGTVYQIIDGQQRITTLLLIACELSFELEKLAEKLEDGSLKDFVRKRVTKLRNFLVVLETDDDKHHRNPVLIRSGDRWGWGVDDCALKSPVAKYLAARGIKREFHDSDDDVLKHAVASVRDCLEEVALKGWQFSGISDLDWTDSQAKKLLFHPDDQSEGASQDLASAPKPLLRLLAFARHFIYEVKVIKTSTKDLKGALALFGPLNSTGQSLTAIELLKPRYVVELEDHYTESAEAMAFDKILEYVEDPNPNRRASNTENLVTHMALAESGRKLGSDLNEQREYLERRFDDLDDKAERREMILGAQDIVNFIQTAWIPDRPPARLHGDRLAELAIRVIAPDHTIVIPVLSRYWKRDDGEVIDAVKAVVAFSTLWRLAKGGTGGVDTEYRKLLLRGVPEADLSPISRRPTMDNNAEALPPPVAKLRSGLRHLLVSGCGGSRQEWVDFASNQNAYRGSRWFTRFALLTAFHDAVPEVSRQAKGLLKLGTEGCAPTLNLDQWEILNTVEHIAPQKRGATGYDDEIYTQSLVHSIGNLALLPLSLNVDAGNRSWVEKRLLFEALGETDREAREKALSTNGLNLRQTQKDRLSHASHIPGVSVLRDRVDSELTAEFVRRRGRRLCELIYDRLISWL